MICVESVSKRWRRGQLLALTEVSLEVQPGSICALVGPNGAGKSTLLSLLLGFAQPTAGRITLADASPREYIRERGASYLPERFALPPNWRVSTAVRSLAAMDGAAPDAAIAHFGVDAFMDRRIGTLSRGMLQRLGLALALLGNRELIVLDEPTEGLDPVWRVRLRDVIAATRERGATVIVASHDLAEVERVADRAVLLEAGRIRSTLQTRDAHAATLYSIRTAIPTDAVAAAFTDAARMAPDEWHVTVATPAELSERLAALLAMGAVVTAVEPRNNTLEERVQQALADVP